MAKSLTHSYVCNPMPFKLRGLEKLIFIWTNNIYLHADITTKSFPPKSHGNFHFFGNLSARCKAMTCLSPFRVRLSALVILWKEIFYSVHRDFFLYIQFSLAHSSSIVIFYTNYQTQSPHVILTPSLLSPTKRGANSFRGGSCCPVYLAELSPHGSFQELVQETVARDGSGNSSCRLVCRRPVQAA